MQAFRPAAVVGRTKTALHESSVTEPLLYISVLSKCLIGARGSVILFSAGVRNRPARKRIGRENFSHTVVHGASRTDESRKNVLIQVKNGPIDFQPREPFSPLFGAMPQTPLIMEFQLTQEYLGQELTWFSRRRYLKKF